MKKYYLNDGSGQQGPFSIDELKEKNLSPDAPVWYEGMDSWTTAGQLDELKELFVPAATPPVTTSTPPVESIANTTVASPVTVTPVSVPENTPAKPTKKKTAWLSWVLYLLVLAGAGYFVYQDMEKNKKAGGGQTLTLNSQSSNNADAPVKDPNTKVSDNNDSNIDTVAIVDPVTTTSSTEEKPVADAPATTTTPSAIPTTKTTTSVNSNDKKATTSRTTDAQKVAAKKAEDEKKRIQAEALAAKERDYRNNWPRYIKVGNLDIKKDDDGVEAFNIPVFNATNAKLDKVTLRVDYMKKEKKVVKSETVVIYGIPAGGGLNGYAPESKKGNNIKVYIVGITSSKLHFCFPENNGNPADPYFCK